MNGSIQSNLDELSTWPDEELEKEVLLGINLHVNNSRASIAKRILENRRQKRQIAAADKVEAVTLQLEKSHKELLKVVNGMDEIVAILRFIQRHWLPNRPLWQKIVSFIILTILLGIALNIAASAITKFLLHW